MLSAEDHEEQPSGLAIFLILLQGSGQLPPEPAEVVHANILDHMSLPVKLLIMTTAHAHPEKQHQQHRGKNNAEKDNGSHGIAVNQGTERLSVLRLIDLAADDALDFLLIQMRDLLIENADEQRIGLMAYSHGNLMGK